MSIFHLPLRGSQSNHFIFQMKKPDTNSGPLLPILLHSKAETRYSQSPMIAHPCGTKSTGERHRQEVHFMQWIGSAVGQLSSFRLPPPF